MFHEVLQHRWYLAEQAGHDIETFVAAHDYIDNVLSRKPEEAITSRAGRGRHPRTAI